MATTLIRRFVSTPQRPRRQVSSTPRQRSLSPPRRAPAPRAPRPFAAVPGPLALPMLRHSAHVLPRIGSFHHVVGLGLLEGMHARYGDLVRLGKGARKRPVLYVFDPDLMKEVYESRATASPRFERSPLLQQRWAAGCPARGEQPGPWARLRGVTQDREALDRYETILDEIADDASRRLGQLRHLDNALNEDLESELSRWAVEALGAVLLGIRLGCLDGAAHERREGPRKPERTSMDDSIPDHCSLFNKCPSTLSPAERLVRVAREIAEGEYLVRSSHTLKPEADGFADALRAFDEHLGLIEVFVVRALEELSPRGPRPEQRLLAALSAPGAAGAAGAGGLQGGAGAGGPLRGVALLSAVADVMLAGVDALTQTALAMFYQLSLHAAHQQRAHDETRWAAAAHTPGNTPGNVPGHIPGNVPGNTPGYPGRPELRLVAACAREALRLHPATGGAVRRSTAELVVGDYEVPAGVDIVLAHGVSSKSDKQWSRPKAFMPERWCQLPWQSTNTSSAHPLASMPFGETCPAGDVVTKTLCILATRVLERYRLEWHGPAPNISMCSVNKIEKPFYFVLQDAS